MAWHLYAGGSQLFIIITVGNIGAKCGCREEILQ